MVFRPDARAQLEAILGPDLMRLLDMVIAASPSAPEPLPKLTRAEKHEINAKAWRSQSQARRAGSSNSMQALKRRERRIRARPDYDPYK